MNSKALLICFVFVGCGMKNPYAKHEKKCKLNCNIAEQTATKNNLNTSKASSPRSTPAIATDAQFWLENFNKSNPNATITDSDTKYIEALIAISPLLQSESPVSIPRYFASTIADIIGVKKLAENNSQLNINQTCIHDAFYKAAEFATNSTNAKVDYGKCIGLSNIPPIYSPKTGTQTVVEYEAGFEQYVNRPQAFGNFVESAALLAWTPNLFFTNAAQAPLEMYFSKAITQTEATVVQNRATAALKNYSFFSLGISKEIPFKFNYIAATNTLTLAGEVLFLNVFVNNPTSLDDYSGTGAAGDYMVVKFDNFSIASLDPGSQLLLSLTNTNVLSGSITMIINNNEYTLTARPNEACILDRKDSFTAADGTKHSIMRAPLDLCLAVE